MASDPAAWAPGLDERDLAELERLAARVRAERSGAFLCCVSSDVAPAAAAKLEELLPHESLTSLDISQASEDDFLDFVRQPGPAVAHLLAAEAIADPVRAVLEASRDDLAANPDGVRFILYVSPHGERQVDEVADSLPFRMRVDVGWARQLRRMGLPVRQRIELELLPRIDAMEDRLSEEVCARTTVTGDFLMVLRRWNSFSPLMRHRSTAADPEEARAALWSELRREVRGGGYLLRWRGTCVAVDPGHDFVENLLRLRLGVAAIDAVVVTHDHPDHVSDLLPLLDLLHQFNARRGAGQAERKVRLFLAPTVHRRFEAVAEWSDDVESPARRLRTPERRGSVALRVSEHIGLRSLLARHDELGGQRKATSLLFELREPGGAVQFRIGFTGDTAWTRPLSAFLRRSDVVVLHLGSVKAYELEHARQYPRHLGILGTYRLVEDLAAQGRDALVILSEFGEELRGARDVLARDLMEPHRASGLRVIPGDIGHRIDLRSDGLMIRCGRAGCRRAAATFFEDSGEIRLRCPIHGPHPGVL